MYFVLRGSGFVEMIDSSGFSRVELKEHSALVFSPGTIHRLVNPKGDMEILVVMANSGLPERGDNVVTFKKDILLDPALFKAAIKVETETDAKRRRNEGVEGFLELKAAFDHSPQDGRQALEEFYQLAIDRTAFARADWRDIVTDGALSEVRASMNQLNQLDNVTTRYLYDAQHHVIHPSAYSKLGFCGHLNRYFDPSTLALEGIKITS
jgi:hypothetical protein